MSVRVDPALQYEGDLPPDLRKALEIIRAEICPHHSLVQMGERIIDEILLSYKSAIAVEIDFVLRKRLSVQGFNQQFQVFKERSLEEDTAQHVHDQARCEYRCLADVPFIITTGAEKQKIGLFIETKETPEPLRLGNKYLSENIQGKKVPGNLQSQHITFQPVYPMFDTLHDILNLTQKRSYVDMQALGLDLAKLAFQKADESFTCNYLKEIAIRGRHFKPKSYKGIFRTVNDRPSKKLHLKHKSFLIRLQRSDYEDSKRNVDENLPATGMHQAYVALGSNIGDRLDMIECACLEMDRRGINVVRTSALYETEPMYLEDQQPFINGACEVGIALT